MQSTSANTLVNDQSGLSFAKDPIWVDERLLFLDTGDRSIKSADLNGTVQLVRALPFLPGSFCVLTGGEIVIGDSWRRKLYRLEERGQTQTADLGEIARSCLGDCVADCRGGIYVGDIGFDILDPLVDPVPNGVIFYISADGKMSRVADDLLFPGGMVIEPGNRRLIVAEKLAHRLTAFDIDTDGSLNRRRVWAQFQDDVNPGGICLDREGAVWVAGSDRRALRVIEGGETDQQVTSKQRVFYTTLGGPERKHLFMCTSASSDPVITRRAPQATIDIAVVKTAGVADPDAGEHYLNTRSSFGEVVKNQ